MSSDRPTTADRVSASVGEGALDPAAALAAVQSRAAGAAVVFTVVVRDHDQGRAVNDLE